MNESAIALHNLRKRYATVTAVDSVTLEVAPGEFFSLLGPSGCGKTTLLRLIAGFEQPDGGALSIGGERMEGVPPQARAVNTVFQNYALFPHLSVFENVAFGLRVRKTAEAEIRSRVNEALETLHVGELRDRRPAQISGGQKQRVALARALVVKPKVLLLDEPLAAVDAQRRAQVQHDLKALQRKSRTTFLYVTHDQDEALSLSDRLAVMQAGRIAQLGAPRDVYDQPRNRFVASFLGRANLFSGTKASETQVRTPVGTLQTARPIHATTVTVGIRPERIQLGVAVTENSFHAEVASLSYTGASIEYVLTASGTSLRALAPSALRLNVGESVPVHLPREALFVFDEHEA
jgi:spermidine/putrescine transport system ATP-binding protein